MDKLNASQLRDVSMEVVLPQTIKTSQDKPKKPRQAREYTSIIIGWILRAGVILSATIILIGFLLLITHSGGMSGFGVSSGTFPHTLGQVWSGLLVLQPQAIIASGLLLLIVTPVITVTTSAVAFAVERDRRFVVIALVVLAILITSMLIGKGGG
jgi:uncharacterized membrane protein